MTLSSETKIASSRESLLTPFAILLVSRIGLILFSYLGLVLIPGSGPSRSALPGNHFLDGWARWDSFWYARIAQNGYDNTPVDNSGQRDTAFFPLFPATARIGGWVLGSMVDAGLIISNVSFFIAGLMLYRLIEIRWNGELARRALLLLCVYPYSYAYTAMYTESLFLLCVVAAFWFGEKQQWLAAALFAGAASATRLVGIATAAALLLSYLQSIDWQYRRVRWNILWLLIGGSGLLAYIIFLWARFNEPFAFISAHNAQGWGETVRDSSIDAFNTWRNADFGKIASGNVPLLATFNILFRVLAGILCIVAWFRLPIPYAAWATMTVLISYSGWYSFPRYFGSVFPLFILAAMLLQNTRLYHGLIYASVLLLALFTLMFTHGYWVA